MNDFLFFDDLKVEVLYAPKLKHSYLRVNADSTLVVKTPRKSQKFILSFLEEKKVWIEKQLLFNQENMQIKVNLENEVLLFGEIYSIDSQEAIYLQNKLAKLKPPAVYKVNRAYNDFYKYKAQEYLSCRIEYFSKIMQLSYSNLKFRKMKSRWGSCSSKKEITLNTQLMKVKKEFIDYVIVHELSHLVHMNHSKEFHAFVERYLSNSKELRKGLKKIRLLD